MTTDLDKRPPPKPRRYPRLWQLYLTWKETNKMINRHVTRLASAERGKSGYDVALEKSIINSFTIASPTVKNLERIVRLDDFYKSEMINEARETSGPIFDWLIAIKGIGEASAVKLIAQVDDPGKFRTISKLWRFSGYGTYSYWFDQNGKVMAPQDGWKWHKLKKGMVITCPRCEQVLEVVKGGLACVPCEWKIGYGDPVKLWTVTEPKDGWVLKDGVRDRMVEEWHCPYNAILKAELYVVVDGFIKHRTPLYRGQYDRFKVGDRRKHPEVVKTNGRTMYNDGHIDNRARRKVAKLFLQHLWMRWREFEGLPVSKPWILRPGSGHTGYVEPDH